MKHDDLVRFYPSEHYDTDATLECYFHSYSGNLWFVYIGDHEIVNIMSSNTIAALEEEYSRYCRKEHEEHIFSLSQDRYEDRMNYKDQS